MTRFFIALLGVGGVLLPTTALAQEWLQVSPLQGGIQGQTRAGWGYQSESGDSQDLYWATRVLIRNRVSLLDPGLLSLGVAGSIGFFQDRLQSQNTASRSNSMPVEYDLGVSALDKSKFPTHLHAARSQRVTRLDLGGLSRNDSENAEGSIRWRNGVLEPSLNFNRTQSRETVRQGVTGATSEREDRSIRGGGSLSRAGPTTQLNADYGILNLEDLVDPARDYNAQDASFHHKAGVSRRFSTSVNFHRRGPFLAQQQFRAAEDVSLDHTPTLSSQHGYSFARSDSQDLFTATHAAKTGISHQLFGSLNERLDLAGTRRDFTSGRETEGGPNGRLGYRKKAGPGDILAGVGGGYNLASRKADAAPLRSVNETHALEDGLPVLLEQRDADAESVVVTDAERELLYQRGFDYDLTTREGYVELVRLPGGRIRDNQEVWVSYTHSVPGSAVYDRRSVGYDLGYDLHWLRLFYQQNRLRLHPLKGGIQSSSTLSDNVGVEGRFGGSPLLFSPLAERRSLRQDTISYVTYIVRQPLAWEATSRMKLQLTFEELFFSMPGNGDFQTYSAELSGTADFSVWTVRPGTRYWLRYLDGSEKLWTSFIDFSGRIGKLESSLGLDYNRWNVRGSARQEFRTDFSVTRWF
ncbi:MAG: hypothetical protein HYT87_19595 [Nitrospirae bacterium]|nr:hypothetical protein [Nitrospirota bacterium]